MEAGHVPCIGDTEMKNDDLKLCIEALKALREEKHQELGTSITLRLDQLILKLEECSESNREVPAETRQEAIQVLANAIVLATNLVELIRNLFGSS
jgi:hypothetical protein